VRLGFATRRFISFSFSCAEKMVVTFSIGHATKVMTALHTAVSQTQKETS